MERIDCRGLFCPEPIIALQRAAQRAAPATRIEVVADDPGFAEDVRLWSRSTGHRLDALDRGEGDLTIARVTVGGSREEEKNRE